MGGGQVRQKVNVAIVAGGAGGYNAIRSIVPFHANINLTSISGTWDNGGGSGRLMANNHISLPPGDLAQCLLAMAQLGDRELLAYVYRDETGQSLINRTLVAYERCEGGFEAGYMALAARLGCLGRPLIATCNRTMLRARLKDGRWLEGEDQIDEYHNTDVDPFDRIELIPHNGDDIIANPRALQAIAAADIVIVGPGSFYTSIAPNYHVEELRKAVVNSQAPIVAVANLANEPHTRGWTAHRFAEELSCLIGRPISHLIANNGYAPDWLVQQYQDKCQDIVEVGQRLSDKPYTVVERDLLSKQDIRQPDNAGGVNRSLLRHPPHHLGATLLDIFADLGFNRQW